jgi:hypothetical protein
MSCDCKKCGGALKQKGYVYNVDKTPRYKRWRCVACKAVEYHPCEYREDKTWSWVEAMYAAGKLEVWDDGKKWGVK